MSWLRIPDPRTSASRQSIDLLLIGASFAMVSSISDALRITVYKVSGWGQESVIGAWIHVFLLLLTAFGLVYFFFFTGLRRPPAKKQTNMIRRTSQRNSSQRSSTARHG